MKVEIMLPLESPTGRFAAPFSSSTMLRTSMTYKAFPEAAPSHFSIITDTVLLSIPRDKQARTPIYILSEVLIFLLKKYELGIILKF